MRRVLLYSGGLDSFIAWHLLGLPKRVYVRIGAPYEERELDALARQQAALPLAARRLGGVQVVEGPPVLGGLQRADGHVPCRNLVFAVTAAALLQPDEVVLTALAGETSPDKSRRFARAATRALSQAAGRPVRLAVPFRGVTKADLVRRYLAADYARLEVSQATLRACPSCYAAELPAGVAGCGACQSCLRRWVAMSLNGLQEVYLEPPWKQERLRPSGAWWQYLRRVPVAEWGGVARANLELLLALRLVRRGD